jgi:toxin ParE1/3/4
VFEIELLFHAENELSEAYEWYEEQQPDMGNKLFDEINHYLTLVETNPLQFPIRYAQDLRTAPLKIFPYFIIYWIDEHKHKVFVTSIFHTSRRPQNF